jgi:glutamyl-tRNA synthetase
LRLPFDDPELPVAWRFRVDAVEDGPVVVDDALQGRVEQLVSRDVGDFVVKRKDGLVAYQLAVVVDDALQGVTEVVRGRDLLSSAPRQVLLFTALGRTPPRFAHVPLWLDAVGNRVSKRNGTSPHSLRTLFARGETGPRLLGRIGAVLGVNPDGASLDARALADLLDDAVLARASVEDPSLD